MIHTMDTPEAHAAETLLTRDGWPASWRKPDTRPIYEWAADYLSLPQTYAQHGRFVASPWMRPVFDVIKSATVREVWLMASIQSGKTLISDVSIPWVLVNHPGPVMLTMQSEEDTKEHMKTRLWPLFRSCRPLMGIMPANRHDRTTQEIYFGNHFFIANGVNLNSLQSKSIQWKFNDELWIDKWQDLYVHARGRVSAYENIGSSKIVNVSQAGNVGDVMDRGYESGTRRTWVLDGRELEFFGTREDGTKYGLTWSEDAKRADGSIDKARAVETCRYETEDGTAYDDSAKTRKTFMERGRWSDAREGSDHTVESFQFNSLPTRPMKLLVAEWCEAYEYARRGNMGPMADFTRKRRCRPWEDRQEVVTLKTKGNGYSCDEYADGKLVDGEFTRFMTIDRQRGMSGDVPHWWTVVRSWREDGSSRLLFAGRVDTVEDLEYLRDQYGVDPRLTMQDAGYDTSSVYDDCVRFGWSCAFGSHRRGWEVRQTGGRKVILPHSPLRPVQHGRNRLFTMEFSADYHKDILGNLISGAGASFEIPDDVGDEYRRHMAAEDKVEVQPGKWKWLPRSKDTRYPNHLWDAEVMQVVLAVIRGLLARDGSDRTE